MSGESKLLEVNTPVSEALILICEKCGKKLASEADENPARDIQQSLKEEIKNRGGKGKLRAVLTTCMDICPIGELAIGVSWSESRGGRDQFYTLKKEDLKNAPSIILDHVKKEDK